jgi:hypothetical protein
MPWAPILNIKGPVIQTGTWTDTNSTTINLDTTLFPDSNFVVLLTPFAEVGNTSPPLTWVVNKTNSSFTLAVSNTSQVYWVAIYSSS